jgi:excisionase family DNA binding protein
VTAARPRLTAVEVARACAVDLKTIHNWARKGKLACTRTGGGHLRFHRLDVTEMLRRHAHPVPDALIAHRLRVCVAGDGARQARRAFARKVELVEVAHVIDALVTLAAIDPDALVIEDASWLDDARVLERLRASEATRHVRVVVVGGDDARRAALMRAGARFAVPRDDATSLREALDRIAFGAV